MQYVDSTEADSFYACLLSQITDDTHPIGETCLITGTALEEPIVKLDCGHAFNYKPLLEEVRNQKDSKSNCLEVQKLRLYQMKCPYCRAVHDLLLPLLEGEDHIVGVNWPRKYTMSLYKCSYTLRSGKRKGLLCQRQCNELLCPVHRKVVQFLNECAYRLNSGKRKGLLCERKCNGSTCPAHTNFVACGALLLSSRCKGRKCLRRGRDSGLCRLHENKNKEP